jgi:uncharacterized protein YciI
MLYALITEDAPDSLAKRLAVRPEHLARLQQLADAGRLVLAGPMPAIDSLDPGPAGFLGSLIVAEFENQAAAQAWLDDDPYAKIGVFAKASARPFKHVLP